MRKRKQRPHPIHPSQYLLAESCREHVARILFLCRLSGKSYNQPKLCLNASWQSNATTVASKSLVGLQPVGIYVNTDNSIYVADRQNERVLVWHNKSSTPTKMLSGSLNNPWSIFATIDGNIYVDNGGFNNRIDKWMLNATSSTPVMTVHGSCTGLFVLEINNTLYCSLENQHHVVKVELDCENMTSITVAGTGCPGPVPNMLDHPHGIYIDMNLYLYVADTYNNRIQRFAPDQIDAKTVAGFGAPIYFILNRPTSVVLDADGYLFIVESENHRIIRSLPNGFQCLAGCSGRSGTESSQLHNPQTMTFDSDGNILVTDMNNHRIQKFILTKNAKGTSILHHSKCNGKCRIRGCE